MEKTRKNDRLTKGKRVYIAFKLVLDVSLAAVGLLLFWWVLVAIALAIVIEDGTPVIFRQKRVGKDGTYFNIMKFRTMRRDTPRDMPTHLLKNPEQYITRVGKFLRKTSLDELPQIFNILVGQMSFVGPRPALYNQEDLLLEREAVGADQVRPGLTGWAQIHGRDELEIEQKAALDGEYVQRMGLWMDIGCFFGTFLPVLKQEGVLEGGTGAKGKDEGEGT